MMSEALRKAAEAALAELEKVTMRTRAMDIAEDYLRAALAEPEQSEPVAVFHRCNNCGHAYEGEPPTQCDCMEGTGFDRVEYLAAPPRREPLSDGWQPIETAPRYGRILVTGTEIGTCVASAGWDTETPESVRWGVVNDVYVTPTHWMTLPPGITGEKT